MIKKKEGRKRKTQNKIKHLAIFFRYILFSNMNLKNQLENKTYRTLSLRM